MIALLAVTLIALLDRLTKALALMTPTVTVPLVGSFLTFQPAVNLGGVLRMPLPVSVQLGLAFGLILALFALAVSEADRRTQTFILSVVLGLLSNTYDRWRFGYVIDTLRLAPGLALNVADVLILIGVVFASARLLYRARPYSTRNV